MTECGRMGRTKFIVISDFTECIESQLSRWSHKFCKFISGKCTEGLNNKSVSAGSQDISTFLSLQGAKVFKSFGYGTSQKIYPNPTLDIVSESRSFASYDGVYLSRRAGTVDVKSAVRSGIYVSAQLPFSGSFCVGQEIPGGQIEEDGSTSKNCRKNNKSNCTHTGNKFVVTFKKANEPVPISFYLFLACGYAFRFFHWFFGLSATWQRRDWGLWAFIAIFLLLGRTGALAWPLYPKHDNKTGSPVPWFGRHIRRF